MRECQHIGRKKEELQAYKEGRRSRVFACSKGTRTQAVKGRENGNELTSNGAAFKVSCPSKLRIQYEYIRKGLLRSAR